MHIRIISEVFEKYKLSDVAFFSCKTPDVFLMNSHVYKQLNCIMIFYFYLVFFHFFYFIVSAPISFILCFLISPSLKKNVLSQAFIKCGRNIFV